jgi:hypothetical protein
MSMDGGCPDSVLDYPFENPELVLVVRIGQVTPLAKQRA